MKKLPQFFSLAVSLIMMLSAPALTFAQTSSGSSTPATNISNEYSYFLKNVNSQQVVNDLRDGQWTTTTTDPQTNTSTTTTQPLPTGKMGYGNVKISLALAQQSLNQEGITQPTSQQLYTALAGGEMVPGDSTSMTTGILQMRAQGMGWGQIAQKYNVKLGQLMSGKQPASATTASTTSTTTTNKGTTATANSSNTSTGKEHGSSFSTTKSQDSGIVSASGRSTGTYSSSNGNGIVSGSGRSIGQTSGIVTGAGNGNQYGASGGSHGNSGVGMGRGK